MSREDKMSLQQWLDNAWIHKAETTAEEVSELLDIARREISDASVEGLSPDGRFAHAYGAVRCLCELALHACGYHVPKGSRQHERTIGSLRFSLGDEWAEETDYFDQCRRLRNQSMYERFGTVQQQDADELLEAARKLQDAALDWLHRNHADLI